MNKRVKKILYFFIITILFLIKDRIILMFELNNKDRVVNNILLMENNDLKKEVEELSQLNYSDYNYVLGKITINNLYNSKACFIKTNDKIDNNLPVINEIGMIGLYKDGYLENINDLNISIKINDIIGNLEKGIIKIPKGNYKANDLIYTSGLTNIPSNLLIGKIKEIKEEDNGLTNIIEVEFIDNKNTYVGILNG